MAEVMAWGIEPPTFRLEGRLRKNVRHPNHSDTEDARSGVEGRRAWGKERKERWEKCAGLGCGGVGTEWWESAALRVRRAQAAPLDTAGLPLLAELASDLGLVLATLGERDAEAPGGGRARGLAGRRTDGAGNGPALRV